jgi:hypothetical protein
LISETVENTDQQTSSAAAELRQRISKKTARVGVLGLMLDYLLPLSLPGPDSK